MVFLLLQPILHIIFEQQESPVVAILLDNSKSMTIEDDFGKRSDSLNYILRETNFVQFEDSVQFPTFTFQDSIKNYGGDSLRFDGKQTNISQAIKNAQDSLLQKNLQAMVLVSDGQFNQGVNPLNEAEDSAIPIHTVGIGDSTIGKDIRISGLQVNRVAYANEEIPVNVRLIQRGFEKGDVVVQLKKGNKLVEAKTVDLPESGFEQQIEFKLQLEKPGSYRYVVEINPRNEEKTSENNSKSYLLNVLRNKMRVLLISGSPTFDQRILTYVLKELTDMELTVLTEKSTGNYYENEFRKIQTDSQDVFIFLGFPTNMSSGSHLKEIFDSIQKNNAALFLFLNEFTQLQKLKSWNNYLPLPLNSGLNKRNNIPVQLTSGGRLHPVSRIEELSGQVLSFWNDLPPVTSFGKGVRIKDGTQTLLREKTQGENNFPLLLASVRKDVKMLVFAVADFNTWHLQLQDDPERDNFFKLFMERSVKWLFNKEDIQRIQIQPDKEVYQIGETVQFSGEVFDEFYNPLNDAEVEIQIQTSEFKQNDIFTEQNGFYRYQTSGLPPGTYQFKIRATDGERVIGTKNGRFIIEELELEMRQTEANITLMKEIASRSGGEFWSAREFVNNLEEFQKFKQQIRLTNMEYVVWDKIYWLIAVIVLLSLEWFFRKRWGLL